MDSSVTADMSRNCLVGVVAALYLLMFTRNIDTKSVLNRYVFYCAS